MAAAVVVAERNGPDASAVETLDPANLNMGSSDEAELVPATDPITAMADGHAFEKWFRIFVSGLGGSTVVDNLRIWLSDLGGGYATGEGMSANLKTSGYSAATYPTAGPVQTDSPDATEVMPISEPASANLGIGGALAGSITSAPAYSDFGVLQLDVTAATPAGSLNQKTITFQWDEQ